MGWVAKEALSRGFSYSGVEPNSALRELALSTVSEFEKENVDIYSCSLPELEGIESHSYTHAFALHVLEHTQSAQDAREWLEGVCRVVAPGGEIVIASPDARDYRWWFFESDWSHGWVTTPSRIAAVGRDLGLEIIEERVLRAGFSGVVSWVLWTLGKVFPIRISNWLFLKAWGTPNFGIGVASGLFLGLCWVRMRTPNPAG